MARGAIQRKGILAMSRQILFVTPIRITTAQAGNIIQSDSRASPAR